MVLMAVFISHGEANPQSETADRSTEMSALTMSSATVMPRTSERATSVDSLGCENRGFPVTT